MKRILFILGFMIAGLGSFVFAADQNPLEFSLQGGGVFPQKDQRIDKDTFYGDARVSYDLLPYMALGGEVGWMRFTDKVGSTTFGHLYSVPVLGDLILKFPIPQTDNRLVPYILGGAGGAVSGYREEDVLDNAGIKVRPSFDFAAKGSAGFDYYVTKQVAIFIEGSYYYSKFDPKVEGGSIGGKIDTRSYLGGAGIKLAF